MDSRDLPALAPGDDSQTIYGDGSLGILFDDADDSLTAPLWAEVQRPAPRAATLLGAGSSDFVASCCALKPVYTAYHDPIEAVRERRRFGTDEPETWDPMSGGLSAEVVLFSTEQPCTAGGAECAGLLRESFKSCFGPDAPSSVSELVGTILERSNYQVLSVTRLQNIARYSMHKSFGRSYGIDSTRRVYHGTSQANAGIIARVGFRNAASQRAKFGKGIYAAANVWEALAYAEPAAQSNVQTFLAADLFQGPTRVGHENMADFGLDLAEKQILTTTNPEETVFCAAYEDQLYAHYCVTVRFMIERALTSTATSIVRLWHPSVWSLLKAQSGQPPSVRKPVFAVPLPATLPRAARVKELKVHMGFRQGDTVKVVQTLKPFPFCLGATGRIDKIIKDGHVHFCVELDDPALRERLKLRNSTAYQWHTDLAMMRCRISHIQRVPPTPAAAAQVSFAAAADAALLLSISLQPGSASKRKRD
jgi:hypothetical protein